MRNVANVKKQGFQLFGGLLLMVMKRLFSELSSITLSSDSALGKGQGVTYLLCIITQLSPRFNFIIQ